VRTPVYLNNVRAPRSASRPTFVRDAGSGGDSREDSDGGSDSSSGDSDPPTPIARTHPCLVTSRSQKNKFRYLNRRVSLRSWRVSVRRWAA
jgi:hypothetical protein